MTSLGISVALCTYNGAPFLHDQLQSLLRQTRAPIEVIICDDASTDSTPTLLQAFADEAPFPVHIHHNERTLGSTINFEKAIQLCSGELIALCDQDDVWEPARLQRGAEVLEADPGIGLVCSNARVVDETLNDLGMTMSERLGVRAAELQQVFRGEALNVLVHTNFVTGTTMTFRSTFVPDLVPIPPGWIQDGWIAIIVSLKARLAYINEPLVRYRQHAGNQIGAPARGLAGNGLSARATLAREAQKWASVVERAAELAGNPPPLLAAKRRHMAVRAGLPRARIARVPCVLREVACGNYQRFSAGAGSALKDLLLP